MKNRSRTGAWTAGAVALLVLTPNVAQARKVWDPGDAIKFEMSGGTDWLPPSNAGDNGLQTTTFSVANDSGGNPIYTDSDHWIDDDESLPQDEKEGKTSDALPSSDIDFSPDNDGPNGIKQDESGGWTFVYTAAEEGGSYPVKFTGTDRSQTVPDGESGNRRDPDNTDNWWDDELGD